MRGGVYNASLMLLPVVYAGDSQDCQAAAACDHQVLLQKVCLSVTLSLSVVSVLVCNSPLRQLLQPISGHGNHVQINSVSRS